MFRMAFRLGCLALFLFLGIIICMVVALVLVLVPRQAAASALLSPGSYAPIHLASTHAAAPNSPQARGRFYNEWVSGEFYPEECAMLLAGDPGGKQPLWVDDRLTLVAHLQGGLSRRWTYDFRKGARVLTIPAVDLRAEIGTDMRFLEVLMEDLQPPTYGSSDLWLLPCANLLPSPTPTSTATPLSTSTPAIASSPTFVYNMPQLHTATPVTPATATVSETSSVAATPTQPAQVAVGAIASPAALLARTTALVRTAASLTPTPDAVVLGQSSDGGRTVAGIEFPTGLGLIAGALFLLIGLATIMFVVKRRRDNALVQIPADNSVRHILNLHDPLTGEQLQEYVGDLPIGIALRPLRVVEDESEAHFMVVPSAEGTAVGSGSHAVVITSAAPNRGRGTEFSGPRVMLDGRTLRTA